MRERLRVIAAPLALVALVSFNAAVTPNFLSLQTLAVNLSQMAPIVIVAIGMTLVIATGGIDLSVGSLMAIAGALAPMIFLGKLGAIEPVGLAVAVAMLAALAAATGLGAANGWLIARFGIQPIVATLVLFTAGRGVAQVMTNGNLQPFRVPEFQWIGLGRLAGLPVQAWLALALAGAAAFALGRMAIGRQVLAVGGNETAARLAGVPVGRVKVAVYAFSGFCAGLAALVVIAINSASDANLVGLGMELDAIAAVAVGGTALAGGRASVAGTIMGAAIIQLVRTTLLANGIPDAAALVAKSAIIVLAVWLQSRAGAR